MVRRYSLKALLRQAPDELLQCHLADRAFGLQIPWRRRVTSMEAPCACSKSSPPVAAATAALLRSSTSL